jgi:hypothetical protein
MNYNKDIYHLASLRTEELWNQFEHNPFPKWGTMCLLRYLNIPVLDALFLSPTTDPSTAKDAIRKFASTHHQERVLIRTDGGTESGDYKRGGNSPVLKRAIEIVLSVLKDERAIVATIPTNRFDNRLAVNLALDINGSFRIEVAGPGFDISDINRGLILPEITAHATQINWSSFEKPSFPFCSIETPNVDYDRRVRTRLRRTANELLPRYGVTQDPEDTRRDEVWAKDWLIKHGNTGLFEDERPTLSFLDVCDYYEIAFLIGTAYKKQKKWRNLSISLSDLGNPHGVVYWDVVDSTKKLEP